MRLAPGRWAGPAPLVLAALVVYGLFRVAVRPAMLVETGRIEDALAGLKSRPGPDGAGPGPGGDETAELAGELMRIQARVAALGGVLASPDEAESVLQSLGNTAHAAGVRFLRFAPEPEYRLDGYLASAVSVVAEGSFFDFLNFFEELSRSPYLVLIEDLTLEGAPGGLLRGQFTALTVRSAEARLDRTPGVEMISTAPESDEPMEGGSGK
jgi:hypothetical protein